MPHHSLETLLIASLPRLAMIIGPVAAYALFDQIFNPRSKPGSLLPNQLPITLESGGLLIVPNALIILFGMGILLSALWFSGTIIAHADRSLITIVVGCIAVLLGWLTRGMFIKIYDPTLITIGTEGISFASYKSVRDWHWDQIKCAEVRRVSGARGLSFNYACLCLKGDGSQKSWAVRSGFANDSDIVNLPAMMKSRFGVESAQSVCDLLNSILSRTGRDIHTFGHAVQNTYPPIPQEVDNGMPAIGAKRTTGSLL